ncbi:MAG: hypothetical protein AAGK04_11910 [Planctomycetota bacterium]
MPKTPKLSKRQLALFGVCGFGVLAVGFDRMFLLPASASAGEDASPLASAPPSLAPSTSEPTPMTAMIEAPADAAELRRRLERIVQERSLEVDHVRETFFLHPQRDRVTVPNEAGEPTRSSVRWPTLALSSIASSGAEASAVINERVVLKDAWFEGVRLVEIERDHVLVEFQGELRRLNLPRPGIE